MKITQVEPILVGAPTPGCGLLSNRNYFYILVHTDEGITGLGEATLESHDDSLLGVLKDLSDLLYRISVKIVKLNDGSVLRLKP